MRGKATVENYIRLLAISLAIPFFVSIPAMAMNLFYAGIPASTGTVVFRIINPALCLLWILLCATVVPFCLSGIYRKILSERQERDKTAHAYQKETEKQNKLTQNLANLYNELVEYDRQKTEFFSNVTHELKTPVTIILGIMQLMEQTAQSHPAELQGKYGKHLPTVRQNCYRILRLVNNILDISRLDSGYMKINMINCNIIYLVEEITQSVFPYAKQKNLELEFDTETEEIITAVDVDKIERIILNLLSNAIKFTPPGGKISVYLHSKKDKVVISVKDTGPGIPSNMQTAIFERFHQLENSLAKGNEGSGIGLAIVKSFVELHEGSIRVVSEEGKGSEFIIELPVRQCKSAACSTPQGVDCQNRIIESLNIEFSDIYTTAS